MSINVMLHPYLRTLANGQKVVKTEGNTVGECIDELDNKFPGMKKLLCNEQGKLHSFYDIYVNSENFYPEELDKPVKDGDKLIIVSVVAGG